MIKPIYTQTISGKMVPINKDVSSYISFEDMAYQLARINRFNGASLKNISVARHSLNVAKALWLVHEADWETIFYGLLHDAHEYLIGDITQPVKELLLSTCDMIAFKKVVDDIDVAIFTKAGLPEEMNADQQNLVKEADLRMLATEKRDWLNQPLSTQPFSTWGDLPPPYEDCYACTTNEKLDADEFLQWIKTLQLRIKEENKND